MADTEGKKVEKKGKPSVLKRIGAWFRSLNSERKKISWASWTSVRKNTFIVLVVVIVLAVVIGVIDVILTRGFNGLRDIVQNIQK